MVFFILIAKQKRNFRFLLNAKDRKKNVFSRKRRAIFWHHDRLAKELSLILSYERERKKEKGYYGIYVWMYVCVFACGGERQTHGA